jgi:hypothetical protein
MPEPHNAAEVARIARDLERHIRRSDEMFREIDSHIRSLVDAVERIVAMMGERK